MVGERDRITPPRHSRAIAERLAGADLVVVPDAGHALILERPEIVNEWLIAMLDPAQPDQAA